MGKVIQAIQEVQEIVYWYVQGNRDITLPEVQTLLFKKYLRGEKKYNSTHELTKQLKLDRQACFSI